LHHFSNPQWFEEKGGFLRKENLSFFLDFVKVCVTRYQGLVKEYITINEPNIYAYCGYLEGSFPPGHHKVSEYLKVVNNLGVVHQLAFDLIKQIQPDARIGFAHHVVDFIPYSPKNIFHRFFTSICRKLLQNDVAKFFLYNQAGFGLHPGKRAKKTYADFLGVNYYQRLRVGFGLGGKPYPGVPINDLDWEICPQGLINCLGWLYQLCPLEIYITENGTCDNTDQFRSRYLLEHWQALENCAYPVKRYYHWCFLDNFEWCEGESARFGIIKTNYTTQERTIKSSGQLFAKVIEEGFDPKQLTQLQQEQVYRIRTKTKLVKR
jgi:beta-glucosidase